MQGGGRATLNVPLGRLQQRNQRCPPIWPGTHDTLYLLASIKGEGNIQHERSWKEKLTKSKTLVAALKVDCLLNQQPSWGHSGKFA